MAFIISFCALDLTLHKLLNGNNHAVRLRHSRTAVENVWPYNNWKNECFKNLVFHFSAVPTDRYTLFVPVFQRRRAVTKPFVAVHLKDVSRSWGQPFIRRRSCSIQRIFSHLRTENNFLAANIEILTMVRLIEVTNRIGGLYNEWCLHRSVIVWHGSTSMQKSFSFIASHNCVIGCSY